MILDAIDVGGGGIVVDVPCRLRDVDVDEATMHFQRVTIEAGERGGSFAILLDPAHARALYRALASNGGDLTLRLSLTPKG